MRSIRHEITNALLIIAGVFSAAMGLKGFLLSSHFIDGGVTGISMLLSITTPLPLALWLPVVNLPFVVLGSRQMGPAFALRSGQPKAYVKATDRGGTSRQLFCPDCASPIYSTTIGSGPRTFNLRLGTARQRAQLRPTKRAMRPTSDPRGPGRALVPPCGAVRGG